MASAAVVLGWILKLHTLQLISTGLGDVQEPSFSHRRFTRHGNNNNATCYNQATFIHEL